MGASAARDSQYKAGDIHVFPIGAVKVYKGTMLFQRIDGYAYPARSGTVTDVFLGEAMETVDNSGGAAGALSVRVRQRGSIVVALSTAVATDVGIPVYASDDQTVTRTSANNVRVGKVAEIIDTGNVRIQMGTADTPRGRLSKSVAGAANVTLTATEAANHILEFTGALTGDIQVIVPLTDAVDWIVFNNTSGAQTLTVIGASGTGIVVGQGKRAILYSNGTNIVRVTADT